MIRVSRYLLITGVALLLNMSLLLQSGTLAYGNDKPKVNDAALERTREQVRMLDDLYKSAVVSITDRYIEDQSHNPAALVAHDVFKAMKAKGWHSARLVDATGKPKNEANLPLSAFEKKAVEQVKAGKSYYDEVAEVDGKSMLRVGTVVPAVMKQCAVCHGVKQGKVLGAIIYELPIK